MSDVKSYYSVQTNGAAAWLKDGEIAFLNNASGTNQVWKTDIHGKKPEQLSFLSERIWRLEAAPDHQSLLFASDLGGNEQEQIFLIPVGGEPVNLTQNNAARHYLGGMTPDGKTVYFSCNGRNPASFDLCRLDVDTRKLTIVVENEDNYNTPCGVSPDGVYMCYNKLKGMSDNKMWVANMLTGETKDVDPAGSFAQYEGPAWKSDSTGFYLTTDAGSEFKYVAYYDVATDALTRVYEAAWDCESIALSADDRYLAIVINEDGYGVLRILDTKTGAMVDAIQPPKGFINTYAGISWSPEGHRLLFNFSSGKRPAGIWVLDIDEDWLRCVTASPLGDIDPDTMAEPELHEFHSFDGLRVPYWLYRAPGAEAGPGPVVLEIHGGPEGQEFPMYSPLIQYLVGQGFNIVAPNVRGSSGYGKTYVHLDDVEKRLDSVHDVACLVEHLVKTGVADPGRIAVMGASYGGFMTLSCVARYPELWAAGVDTVGMSNLETFLENTAEYRRAHRESEYGTLAHDRETLRRVSPIFKVDQITAPMMVIHGANDPRVPVSEAEQIVASLRSRGVPVKYLRYEDEGHGLSKRKNQFDCYPQVAAFLKEQLGVK